MRFDYFGTGDSAGTSTEASLNTWQTNISSALAELADVSGADRLALCGLRLGGSLAAIAHPRDQNIKKLVLWDPIVSGSAYLTQLRAMQRQLLDNLHELYGATNNTSRSGSEELIGFRYSDDLIAEIGAMNLLEHNQFGASDIRLVVSEPRPEYEQLKNHLESLGILGSYHLVSPAGEWGDLSEIENALIAAETIATICNQFSD